MENSIKSKINLFGRVDNVIISILIVLCIVGGIIIAGFSCLLLTSFKDVSLDVTSSAKLSIPDTLFGVKISENQVKQLLNEGVKVSVDDAELGLSDVEKTDGGYVLTSDPVTVRGDANIFWNMLLIFIRVVCLTAALFAAKALMKEFKNCDSPFTDSIAKKMKTFAYFLIPFVVISSLEVGGGNVVFSLNLGMVAMIIIVFVLAMIFSYGTKLQQQADETL